MYFLVIFLAFVIVVERIQQQISSSCSAQTVQSRDPLLPIPGRASTIRGQDSKSTTLMTVSGDGYFPTDLTFHLNIKYYLCLIHQKVSFHGDI